MKISKNIEKNISYIKNIFGNSSDIQVRNINNITYIFLASVSSDDKISNFLVKSISDNKTIFNIFNNLKNNIYNSNLSIVENMDDILYRLSSGFTIVFIKDNEKAISIETRATLDRGVNESTSEAIIRGPKDSFTENHLINIGLIRKRIKDENLWFKDLQIGKRTKTKVTISYINGIADKNNITEIEKNIKNINIDGILDSSYIKEYLENNSTFPMIMSTERPDLTSGALLEGKIIILVENSPYALILPSFLIDFMHSAEDYFESSSNISLTRILRLISFILTIITPAFYIALTTWNQEILPNDLLISIAIQKKGVPFPTALELILMITTFEILREADIRMPNAVGASVSIVGALILGEAAVSAGIVSPIIIIVVAFTSISGLVFTDIDFINSIRYWRFIFIFFSILLGFIGLVICSLIFLTKLCSMEYLKIPYTIPISPLIKEQLKDSFIRLNRTKINKRAPYLTNNIIKGDNNEKNINNSNTNM